MIYIIYKGVIMNTLYIIIAIVIIYFIASKYLSKGSKVISTTDLKLLMQDRNPDYYYIDVRTPGEFKKNKIKGFKNVPLNQLMDRLNQIPKDKKVVVICQSGARSTSACRQLVKSGYPDITNVRGGMNMWR